MNTAISTMVPTGGAKPALSWLGGCEPATVASLPAAAGSPADPALPRPAARKDGPRSSAEHAKRGEYLQPAVHYAVTALAAHKVDSMRTGFSRWASYAYVTKLVQKRKIAGDPATKLEEREQAHTPSSPADQKRASKPPQCKLAWRLHGPIISNPAHRLAKQSQW
jgi:hypothetical protein